MDKEKNLTTQDLGKVEEKIAEEYNENIDRYLENTGEHNNLHEMSEEEINMFRKDWPGLSIGEQARQLASFNNKGIHDKEFIELNIRIQPIVLRRLIEDELVGEYADRNTNLVAANSEGLGFNDDPDGHNTWGAKNSLSHDAKWVWDWILEALKGGKDSLDFYYEDGMVFGPASVEWSPSEEEVIEHQTIPDEYQETD